MIVGFCQVFKSHLNFVNHVFLGYKWHLSFRSRDGVCTYFYQDLPWTILFPLESRRSDVIWCKVIFNSSTKFVDIANARPMMIPFSELNCWFSKQRLNKNNSWALILFSCTECQLQLIGWTLGMCKLFVVRSYLCAPSHLDIIWKLFCSFAWSTVNDPSSNPSYICKDITHVHVGIEKFIRNSIDGILSTHSTMTPDSRKSGQSVSISKTRILKIVHNL